VPIDRKFWIIVDGTVPTAFRAPNREDLVPTLHQLQRTQPTVTLVWFERGRTWASPEEAREDQERRRKLARERKGTWRPGGAHVDPRAKYQISRDEKRARFKKRATFDRQRSEGDTPPPPHHDKPFADKPRSDRPFSDKPRGDRPFGNKPFGRKPFGSKPPGAKPYGRKPFGSRPQGDRPFGSRPPGDRPPSGDRPFGKRPPRSSEGSSGGSGREEKRPWRPSKPGGWAPRGRPKGPWRPKGPRGPRGPKGGGGR
jgi:hypothetical protein